MFAEPYCLVISGWKNRQCCGKKTQLCSKNMANLGIPSGNFLHSYWKWPLSSLIYPLKMEIFHSCLYVYQRVNIKIPCKICLKSARSFTIQSPNVSHPKRQQRQRRFNAWMVGPLVPLPLSDFGSSVLAPGPPLEAQNHPTMPSSSGKPVHQAKKIYETIWKQTSWTFKSSIIFVRLDYCTFGPFWPFPAKTERSKTKLNRLFHTMSLYHWTWAKNVISCHIIASHR